MAKLAFGSTDVIRIVDIKCVIKTREGNDIGFRLIEI